jgi:hypothetical protein
MHALHEILAGKCSKLAIFVGRMAVNLQNA